MTLKHLDDEWLIIDKQTIKTDEIYNNTGSVFLTLPLLIKEWSYEKPINYKNCSNLSINTVNIVKQYQYKDYYIVKNESVNSIKSIIKQLLKGNKIKYNGLISYEQYKLIITYVNNSLILFNHKGDLLVSPEENYNNVYLDKHYILSLIGNVITNIYNEKMNNK